MSVEARTRAAEALNVPVRTTPGAATSAFLSELPKTDFVPPTHSVAALNSLMGLGLAIDADNNSTLQKEVEEFAQRYWELTPVDRLAEWLTFCTRSPDDPTANRLLVLKAGLELPGTPFPDSPIEQIAAIARELYVLPPRDRAIRRNEWLLANASSSKGLIATAAAIKKNHPAIAALDPDLITRLTSNFNLALFTEAATTSPLPERPYSPSKPLVFPAPKTPHLKLKAKRTPTSTRPFFTLNRVVGSMVFVVMFLALFKLLVLHPSSNEYQRQTPFMNSENLIEKLESPKGNVDKSGDYYYFNETEVKACQNYAEGHIAEAPPRYSDWVSAGKPAAYVYVRRAKSQP